MEDYVFLSQTTANISFLGRAQDQGVPPTSDLKKYLRVKNFPPQIGGVNCHTETVKYLSSFITEKLILGLLFLLSKHVLGNFWLVNPKDVYNAHVNDEKYINI